MFNYSVRGIVAAMAAPHTPDIHSSGLRCHHNITRGPALKHAVVFVSLSDYVLNIICVDH